MSAAAPPLARLPLALALLARFLWEIVRSGLATAWLIVRPGRRPRPALVRMRYEGLSETGASLLAAMVTLTPGTSAVDLDPARRELLLHVLDAGDPEALLAELERTFVRRLRRLFPAEDAA